MKITFSSLVNDLETMYPFLLENKVFLELRGLANIPMYKNQGKDIDGLLKDWKEYVERERILKHVQEVQAPVVKIAPEYILPPVETINSEKINEKESDMKKKLLEGL